MATTRRGSKRKTGLKEHFRYYCTSISFCMASFICLRYLSSVNFLICLCIECRSLSLNIYRVLTLSWHAITYIVVCYFCYIILSIQSYMVGLVEVRAFAYHC